MLEIVRPYTEAIKDGRSLGDVWRHASGEMNELCLEIYPSEEGPGEDGIFGEAVDVISCMLDIILLDNPNVTQDDINAYLEKKCIKWQAKAHEKTILFLDDVRNPEDVTWVYIPKGNRIVVRNYDQFVKHITDNGLPDHICFDHDLADEHYGVMMQENAYTYDDGDLVKTFDYGSEKTGHDCAKWVLRYCAEKELDIPDYTVHSMNPVGAKRISDYLEWAKSILISDKT